ncbi:MAG: heavy metal translocating P-type ATPase [Bdellovibrionales bacterium]
MSLELPQDMLERSAPSQKEAKDFSFLDAPDVRVNYAFGPRGQQMDFYVGGIKCSKCIRKIEDLAFVTAGVEEVSVDLSRNRVRVRISDDAPGFGEFADELVRLGYEPVPLAIEESEDKWMAKENRAELIRLAVAAACAGNIMTFSFANYFGVAGPLQQIFGWISFLLYLPVVTYVAWPFYQGAWSSLKRRQVSIDLPMAIASSTGFLFSTVQLARSQSDYYFDSISGFLFLILLSRFVQRRMQRRALSAQLSAQDFTSHQARVFSGREWEWRTVESLVVGDEILVLQDETIPADLNPQESAVVSLAVVSGESSPKIFLPGSIIPAGATLMSEKLRARVETPLAQSQFGVLLNEVRRFSLTRTKWINQADSWAQTLLIVVFAVAAANLALTWSHGPETAIRTSLALLILACPCAMAFGTPLAMAFALKAIRSAGLLVRDANVLVAAADVKTIVFDKTGTITDSELALLGPTTEIPDVYQRVILSLENGSFHPIAFSLRAALSPMGPLPPVDGWREVPGKGVSGYVYGRFFELRADGQESRFITCGLYEDGILLFNLEFSYKLRPGADKTIEDLRRQGFAVKLVSGDHKDAVHSLAQSVRMNPADVHAEVSPAGKAQLIRSWSPAMMIGDGANDALALMHAKVGVAVSGGVETALKSAFVYLTKPDVSGVAKLLEASRMAKRLIRQNLWIAVLYNLVAGTLALMGFIGPFGAALLMPVNSGLILALTWWRARI